MEQLRNTHLFKLIRVSQKNSFCVCSVVDPLQELID